MDERRRIVMPTVAATCCCREQQTRDKLYSTSYTESFGYKEASGANFIRYFRHSSNSGFTANIRPAIHYRPSMDIIDNPKMGLILSDNYVTQTTQDFQPYIKSESSGNWPNLLDRAKESGFHQLRCHPKEAILEKKTAYQRMFEHDCSTASHKKVLVGPKTETGFTREQDQQPRKPIEVGPHHSSVTQSDFINLQCNEAKASTCNRSCRESGYTRGAIYPVTFDLTPIPQPSKLKSEEPTQKTMGKKELTGFLSNAPNDQALPDTPFDCSHFTTQYQNAFCQEMIPVRDRSGILSTKMSGGYRQRDMDRFILRGKSQTCDCACLNIQQ